VECTINRVGDSYFRQLERSGHLARIDDLDRFAGLGIEAIRYPVLWEQHAPDGEDERGEIDWSWADARLGRLRALGVRPIVGLVHHGSGPARTSLVDPAFATRLAAYARAVAERFPWVEDWTPVNEPLTTARFSTLYGVWYPHARDPRQFARAIVTQCRATQLAMRAIRDVVPAARLVQTEDLGRIHATPPLAGEAELHNERRWLGFDLLCGRVDPQHPFWPILRRWGIDEGELDAFRAAPCAPDVVGINYYLTSDRFLDHQVGSYPDRAIDHAGEQFGDRELRAPLRDPDAAAGRRHAGDDAGTPFVDVEAVRASADVAIGVAPRLREAWLRYGLPLAVTESHLGCTREEQMRWLCDTWRAARSVRDEGVDVRAVTVWSLLGAFDWNSLVTRDEGFYEPGAFDVRSATPRPTAIATLTRQLARGIEPDHPVLQHPGWWARPERLFRRTEHGRACIAPPEAWTSLRDRGARPLVITGAGGMLGSAFARVCDLRGIP
jgi:dTDP-4-dehydrorhamnose reductase